MHLWGCASFILKASCRFLVPCDWLHPVPEPVTVSPVSYLQSSRNLFSEYCEWRRNKDNVWLFCDANFDLFSRLFIAWWSENYNIAVRVKWLWWRWWWCSRENSWLVIVKVLYKVLKRSTCLFIFIVFHERCNILFKSLIWKVCELFCWSWVCKFSTGTNYLE